MVAFHEMEKHMPELKPSNLCLDSAMDNYPTYCLLKDRGISAFIDLNSKRGRPKSIPDTITIDRSGTLICNAGLKTVPNGYDKSGNRLMILTASYIFYGKRNKIFSEISLFFNKT